MLKESETKELKEKLYTAETKLQQAEVMMLFEKVRIEFYFIVG